MITTLKFLILLLIATKSVGLDHSLKTSVQGERQINVKQLFIAVLTFLLITVIGLHFFHSYNTGVAPQQSNAFVSALVKGLNLGLYIAIRARFLFFTIRTYEHSVFELIALVFLILQIITTSITVIFPKLKTHFYHKFCMVNNFVRVTVLTKNAIKFFTEGRNHSFFSGFSLSWSTAFTLLNTLDLILYIVGYMMKSPVIAILSTFIAFFIALQEDVCLSSSGSLECSFKTATRLDPSSLTDSAAMQTSSYASASSTTNSLIDVSALDFKTLNEEQLKALVDARFVLNEDQFDALSHSNVLLTDAQFYALSGSDFTLSEEQLDQLIDSDASSNVSLMQHNITKEEDVYNNSTNGPEHLSVKRNVFLNDIERLKSLFSLQDTRLRLNSTRSQFYTDSEELLEMQKEKSIALAHFISTGATTCDRVLPKHLFYTDLLEYAHTTNQARLEVRQQYNSAYDANISRIKTLLNSVALIEEKLNASESDVAALTEKDVLLIDQLNAIVNFLKSYAKRYVAAQAKLYSATVIFRDNSETRWPLHPDLRQFQRNYIDVTDDCLLSVKAFFDAENIDYDGRQFPRFQSWTLDDTSENPEKIQNIRKLTNTVIYAKELLLKRNTDRTVIAIPTEPENLNLAAFIKNPFDRIELIYYQLRTFYRNISDRYFDAIDEYTLISTSLHSMLDEPMKRFSEEHKPKIQHNIERFLAESKTSFPRELKEYRTRFPRVGSRMAPLYKTDGSRMVSQYTTEGSRMVSQYTVDLCRKLFAKSNEALRRCDNFHRQEKLEQLALYYDVLKHAANKYSIVEAEKNYQQIPEYIADLYWIELPGQKKPEVSLPKIWNLFLTEAQKKVIIANRKQGYLRREDRKDPSYASPHFDQYYDGSLSPLGSYIEDLKTDICAKGIQFACELVKKYNKLIYTTFRTQYEFHQDVAPYKIQLLKKSFYVSYAKKVYDKTLARFYQSHTEPIKSFLFQLALHHFILVFVPFILILVVNPFPSWFDTIAPRDVFLRQLSRVWPLTDVPAENKYATQPAITAVPDAGNIVTHTAIIASIRNQPVTFALMYLRDLRHDLFVKLCRFITLLILLKLFYRGLVIIAVSKILTRDRQFFELLDLDYQL